MLKRFRHHPPTKPQYSTTDCTLPACDEKQQHVMPKLALKQLNLKEIKRLQELIGVYRWYCDVTDSLPLVAISKLASTFFHEWDKSIPLTITKYTFIKLQLFILLQECF